MAGRKNKWSVEKRNAARERMRQMNADPAFKEKHSERMRQMNADPAFKEKISKLSSERMRQMHADPAFKEKISKLSSERMRQMNADPAFNPLAALTKEQREEYDILVKKGGYTRNDALAMVLEPLKESKPLRKTTAAPATTPKWNFSEENIHAR